MAGTSRPLEAFGWTWQSAVLDGQDAPARDVKTHALPQVTRTSPRVLNGLMGLVGLGVALLFGGFLAFVAAVEDANTTHPLKAEGIVALTGGAQRIDDAIELLASGYGRRLLISGVNERTSRDEIAKLNPSQRHWIDCCVDLDYRARNTIGNAIETRRWMRRNGFETVTVVTANYHMPRTLVELRHALGDAGEVVPHAVVPDGLDVSRWWSDPGVARLVGAEYAKFLVAWLRTRFETDPEESRFAVIAGRGRKPVKMVAEPLLSEIR